MQVPTYEIFRKTLKKIVNAPKSSFRPGQMPFCTIKMPMYKTLDTNAIQVAAKEKAKKARRHKVKVANPFTLQRSVPKTIASSRGKKAGGRVVIPKTKSTNKQATENALVP